MNKAQTIFLLIIGYLILAVIMYPINDIISMWMFIVPFFILISSIIIYIFWGMFALLGEWNE